MRDLLTDLKELGKGLLALLLLGSAVELVLMPFERWMP